MKRFLSLFLALVVTVGICLSAPMTIEAEAYSVSRDDGVWLFPLGSNYYNKFTDFAGCVGYANVACPFCGYAHPEYADGEGGHQWQAYYGGHNGIDIGAATGTPVFAPANGVVIGSSSQGSRGITVMLKHDLGNGWAYYSYSQHLSKSYVSVGQTVTVGTTIAAVGATGGNYGAHLHFGIVMAPSNYSFSQVLNVDCVGSTADNNWLTTSGYKTGKLVTNPKNGGTNMASVNAHRGSVTYTFDKNAVSINSTTPTTGITLNTTAKTLKIGDSLTLTATVAPSNATNKTVTWSSSNTKIATVSNGVVKAVANGSATITAKASGGQTATCTIVVAPTTLTPTAKVIIGDNIYEFYKDDYIGNDASTYAKNRGGYLVTLTSEEERNLVYNWVKSLAPSAVAISLGAYRKDSKTFGWESGETWSYAPWVSGEPNNTNGIENRAIMVLDSGNWNDISGTKAWPFVIEYNLNTYISKGNSATGVQVLKLPKNADMSNYNKTTFYRYSDKQFTTSANETLSGWTKYDSKTTYGDWGSAQKTWTKPTESASLKITGTQVFHKYYHYWNYYDNMHCIDSIKYGTNKGYHEIFLTYKLSAVSMADQGGKQAYGSYQCGTEGFNYWFYAGQVTQYTYQTRTVTGTNYFYKWGNWSAWSTTPATANDNRKLETKTSYTYNGHSHQNSGWTTTKNPTCTATGTKVQKCTTCGQVLTSETIPAKGHTQVTVTGKAPTCTATGLTDGKKCSVCGIVTKAQETIAAKGHTTSDWIVTKNATCDAVGSKRMECTVCKTKLHTGTIPMFGHTESGWIVDKQATATEKGSKHIECTVCHKVLKTAAIEKTLSLATPTVSIKNTAKGIQVNWNGIENAQSYIVYRRVYNASTKKWSGWSKLKTGVTATNFTDTTVTLGTQYRYTVRAVNGSVMSKYTSTSTLKYNVTPTVKIANASNGIKVTWSTAANATGYTVYRSEYNTKTKKWSSWKNRGTAKSNKISWTDEKVTSGVQYKYTVRACNGDKIKSSYKASANLIHLAQPTVKIANVATGVKVSWSKVTGVTGYTVYRSEYKDGVWTKWSNRGTAKSNKTSWTDKKVTSGVQYKYTVRAINGSYKSSYKGTSGLLYLAQPTVTVANTNNGIKVSWTQSAGVTGYTVYSSTYNAKTKKWSGWTNRGTVKEITTSWTDSKVKSGTYYKYTVRAVNGGTKSSYIASAKIKYANTEITSSNVKTVATPLLKYYTSLTNEQHFMFIDFFGTDYIKLLPKSWYEKYGVSSDGSAMISVYKFVTDKTPTELKSKYKQYLSDSILNKYNYMFTDETLLVVDNNMYCIYMSGRGSMCYDANSIEFRGKADGGYLVAVDLYNSGLNYCETDVFFIKYTDGRFIVDSLYNVEENHSWDYTNPNADWI